MWPEMEPTPFAERLDEALNNQCADKDPFAELRADLQRIYEQGGRMPIDQILSLVAALEGKNKDLNELREMHSQMCNLANERYRLLSQTKLALVEFDGPLASAVALAEHHPGSHAQAFETREKALKAQNTRYELFRAIKEAGIK
jgi:hypothetical protein